MAERQGKILSYNPTNRQGLIQPAEGGPPALFYLPSVSNPEPAPKANDTVSFDAPEVRKNKQGKAVQGNASSVTIVERAPEQPAAPKREERRNLTSPYPQRKDAKRREPKRDGARSGPRERREGERRTGEQGTSERREGRREGSQRRESGQGREETRQPSREARGRNQRPPRGPRAGESERRSSQKQPTKGRAGAGREKRAKQTPPPPFALPLSHEVPPTVLRSRGAHPGLILNQFIAWPRPDQEGRWHLKDRHKRFFFEKVYEGAYRAYQSHTLPWDGLKKRWEAMLSTYDAVRLPMRLSSRLALNLHTPSVLGMGGLNLERSWGYPTIPGSTVKGTVHAYAEMAVSDLTPEERLQAFGGKGQTGEIIFFDAVPVRRVARINIESVNCTAPAYYAGEAPPTDNQDPSSTPFLTIEPGAEFLFAVAGPSPLREKVLHLLKDAVMCLGVGARTGLGYGRFEEPRERPARPSEPAEATPAEPT